MPTANETLRIAYVHANKTVGAKDRMFAYADNNAEYMAGFAREFSGSWVAAAEYADAAAAAATAGLDAYQAVCDYRQAATEYASKSRDADALAIDPNGNGLNRDVERIWDAYQVAKRRADAALDVAYSV